MPWDPVLVKKLLKSKIYRFVNSKKVNKSTSAGFKKKKKKGKNAEEAKLDVISWSKHIFNIFSFSLPFFIYIFLYYIWPSCPSRTFNCDPPIFLSVFLWGAKYWKLRCSLLILFAFFFQLFLLNIIRFFSFWSKV